MLLYALVLVTAMAQTAIVPLLPSFAHLYRLGPSATALLLALPSVAMLATSAPAGLLADRLGARPVTIAAAALLCASTLAQAVPSYPVVLVGRLAFGVAFGVVWTTGLAWLAQVQVGDTTRHLAATVTSAAVGSTAGPAIAGVLAQHLGLGTPFLVSAGAAAVVALLLAKAPQPQEPSTERPSPTSSLHDLAVVAPRQRGLMAGAGALAISGAVGSVVQLLVPLQMRAFGASATTIGLVLSAAAVLYIGVSALIVRVGRRATRLRTNAVASVFLALALLPAVFSTGSFWVVGALLLTVLPRATVGTIAYPMATRHGAVAGLGDGAVIGLLNGVWATSMVVGPLAAGWISQSLGVRAAYLATIAASLAIAAWMLTLRPASGPRFPSAIRFWRHDGRGGSAQLPL